MKRKAIKIKKTEGGSHKEPLVPVKVRDGLYKVIFNSKNSINKSQPSVYSQSVSITSITSTTVFIHTYNPVGYYVPQITTTSVIFVTPVANTISNAVVLSVYVLSNRTTTVATAPTTAYTLSSIPVFVSTTNPPVVNMNSAVVTNSTTIPLIATTNMGNVVVGNQVHFGNDPTAILPSTIVSVAPDLLSIVISDSRTLPANTVITIIQDATPPIMTYKNNCNYAMDWGLMEQGKYKCNFSFEMPNTNWALNSVYSPVHIYLNMGVNINNYEAGNPNIANNNGGTSSNYIGFAYSIATNIANPYLSTTSKSNCEFFINRIPSNNTTTNISLYGIPFVATNLNIYNKTLWSAGSGCLDYVLTVTFERVPDTQLPFYNIIFNSRYAQTPGGTNIPSNIIQSFNWSVLPEGRYKCSYSVVTSNTSAGTTNATYTQTMINMLYSNLPTGESVWECGNEDGSTRFSNQIGYMGLFYHYVLGSTNASWWLSYRQANGEFIISRPQNNNVQFRCLINYDKSINVMTGSQFPHYTLILHMEKLPD